MNFRPTQPADIPAIITIFDAAKAYLKSQNIDQWQQGYPNEDAVHADIAQQISYVLEKDGQILATTACSFDGETTYDIIYDGAWLTDITNKNYAVIHRIAVADGFKGQNIAGELLTACEHLCRDHNVFSIRVDTHEANQSMQTFLHKHGFKTCGIILLADGARRVAFEKIL